MQRRRGTNTNELPSQTRKRKPTSRAASITPPPDEEPKRKKVAVGATSAFGGTDNNESDDDLFLPSPKRRSTAPTNSRVLSNTGPSSKTAQAAVQGRGPRHGTTKPGERRVLDGVRQPEVAEVLDDDDDADMLGEKMQTWWQQAQGRLTSSGVHGVLNQILGGNLQEETAAAFAGVADTFKDWRQFMTTSVTPPGTQDSVTGKDIGRAMTSAEYLSEGLLDAVFNKCEQLMDGAVIVMNRHIFAQLQTLCAHGRGPEAFTKLERDSLFKLAKIGAWTSLATEQWLCVQMHVNNDSHFIFAAARKLKRGSQKILEVCVIDSLADRVSNESVLSVASDWRKRTYEAACEKLRTLFRALSSGLGEQQLAIEFRRITTFHQGPTVDCGIFGILALHFLCQHGLSPEHLPVVDLRLLGARAASVSLQLRQALLLQLFQHELIF